MKVRILVDAILTLVQIHCILKSYSSVAVNHVNHVPRITLVILAQDFLRGLFRPVAPVEPDWYHTNHFHRNTNLM